jgi:hypothetical protein
MQARATSASTDPPYVSHDPRPTADTLTPQRPRLRYSTWSPYDLHEEAPRSVELVVGTAPLPRQDAVLSGRLALGSAPQEAPHVVK